MSKRTDTAAFGDSTVSGHAEDTPSKKHRLELQEQLKRGSVLAAQLREATKNEKRETKYSTANQIASEELISIFENRLVPFLLRRIVCGLGS